MSFATPVDSRRPGARLSSFKFAFVAALLVWAGTSTITAIVPGPLTLPEGIPDFSQDTSRVTVVSAQSGRWALASTWLGGQIPTSNNVVRILQGHTVTIDDTAAVAYTVAIDGKLGFAPTANTRLKVTNLEVLAGSMAMGTPGVLEIGTVSTPIAANVTAEIVIANSPLGGSVADPHQFGTGIIAFGKMTVHGSVRTPTFVRVATEPRAGHTTLSLSEAVSGWTVGDRLVLPDTRHLKESEVTGSGWINAVNQWEERTVQAVSADGKTLTLNSALQYDHLGARDLAGALSFLPHVGNLTRNVIIRSESATGTRGHMLSNHMADVDIRYAAFKDLGRTTYLPLSDTTNHIGRYPIHMHHVSGPGTTPANGYQFTLVGNAVDGGSVETRFKWGIAVHGSHYGLIQDNVVYNYNGAGVATEDGSESFNVFDHNFALRGMGQPNDSVSEARMAMGTEGVGFWFRGPNNYVRNNVAANYQNPTTEAAYGFAFQFRFLGDIAIPNFKGADTMGTMGPGHFTVRNGNTMPLLQFENNEAYGAMQGGFTLWWVSSQDPQPSANAQESLIKDLKLWNVYNKAVYMYPSQKIVFDGLIIRGSFGSGSRCCGNGIFFADYSSKGIVVRNSDIQGMEEGITAPEAGFGPEPNLTIDSSYLRNNTNVAVPTNGSVNGCWMQNKLVVISNTRFEAPPGRSLSSIAMVRDVASAPECLSKLDEARVYAYNGIAADNFQVYHTSSSVLPRPPSSCTPATRAGISGLTCPIGAQGPVPPTATISVSPAAIVAGAAATLTWSTSNAITVSINHSIGTVAASGTRDVSPAATTTYTLTATNATGSVTATATVTLTAIAPLNGHNAARANSYDDAWQAGANGWVANAQSILAGGSGQVAGMVLWIGDSLTRDPAMGAWAQRGAGKTAEDQLIAAWMHAGLSPQGIDSTDGFALAAPYICSARSYTVGDGLGAWDFMGSSGMPADTNPTTAKQKLQNCSSYPNALNLTTILSAIPKAQFAIPEVNLEAANPGTFTDLQRMVDLLIARNIVPIILTYTYRTDAAFNLLVDKYNTALIQYAQAKKLPLIDLNKEMLARLPFSQWPGRFLSDGVHYTSGTAAYPSTSNPYANGGDPATHTTGSALTYNGYGLKGWLGVQKMKEIKQLVIDSVSPPPAAPPPPEPPPPPAPAPPPPPPVSARVANLRRAADLDGDGKADLNVYRPATGMWFNLLSSTNYSTFRTFQWGLHGDIPVSSDYDGDNTTDLAVFRPVNGTWYLRQSTTNLTTSAAYQWGLPGDVPAPGDYDGDGKADLVVFRPPSGMWYIRQSSTDFATFVTYQWGLPGDVTVPGDYDGDELTDLAVYRPSTGTWYIRPSTTAFSTYLMFQWGLPGDISVPGEYDGDDKTDLAVYRPSTGMWYIRLSSTSYTTFVTYQWGLTGDAPVPSDFDGDGKTDLAVFRPAIGYWFLRLSGTNFATSTAIQWGLPEDIAILNRK